ncbi:oligopeptide/dipeptide ABC transporter, ATP-binding, C-terminal domain protein [Collimonas arenae]|uniref:Oligopeptide/dipeptide ABC transporter, ATP-binding, C-terminal domain protein n=1 Tax=Collimonas arenae TaxID=279058 RepID=A0A127QJ88_9BURK|nr:oligopeptide/dipeptide ABC transporter ATP-binding protein [Collimonas arenae]AMP10107.1 oligopeptide/dipeptide ABC transporter, ATP-binding, C-terminal domain protein [Collimonas arenae]
MDDNTSLIETRSVSKRFGERKSRPFESVLQARGWLKPVAVTQALDAIDLQVMPGEVVGLVGESGCGKSTLGRIVSGLLQPSAGQVLVDGEDRRDLNARGEHAARLKIQMIFQNPYASLNPRLRVDQIVGEAALIHGKVDKAGLDDYVCAQLLQAGLDPQLRDRYPHQFSGGQRQRIGIARALAVQPQMLVCDEAVAALDVSIQAQILNLFMDLREQLGLTYLFISHDLGAVEHVSDRVVIMYLGRIVETATVDDLFARANHPYTQALLAEVPRLQARNKLFTAIKGEIPSPLHPPAGCHFNPRCPHAMQRCREEVPVLKEIAPGHRSACHLNDV